MIEHAEGVRVTIAGRELVSFAGCNTLGLARDARLVEAAREALGTCGVGASASRTTTGTWTIHRELEAALADWFGTDDAVVFPAGWLAGQAVAQALSDHARAAVLDSGSHPALHDAALLAGLPLHEYAHFDHDAALDVGAALGGPALVLSDALDLTRGRRAPIETLGKLAALTEGHAVVDDAHGVGVLGESGLGVTEGHLGERVALAASLSKALGAHGGFTVGAAAFCDRVRKTPVYAGATPLPPSIAAAATAAVGIASSDPSLRERVLAHATRLAARFEAMGLTAPEEPLPWFAIHGRDDLARIADGLLDAGYLAPHIRYTGGPADGIVRIALSAGHEEAEVDALADALAGLV